jgi:hypothetical protein
MAVEAVRGTNHLQKGQVDQELGICPLPEALQSGTGRKHPHPDLNHQQLSPSVPVVAALIITVASQFKYVRDVDTAARSFCIALAAIPREADQLAMELAYSAEFCAGSQKLIESVSREITENIGSNAVNFENERDDVVTIHTCRRAVLAICDAKRQWDPSPVPTNAGTRAAYARIMRLNDKIVVQSNKLYVAMMEDGLAFFFIE